MICIGTCAPLSAYCAPSTPPFPKKAEKPEGCAPSGSGLRYVSVLNPFKKCVPVPFTGTCARVDAAILTVLTKVFPACCKTAPTVDFPFAFAFLILSPTFTC